MGMKPSNCVNQIRDHLVLTDVIDFSAATGDSDPLFVDPEHKWQVVSVRVLVTTAYIAAQAANVNVGILGDNVAFVNNESLGVDLIALGDLGDELAIEEDNQVLEKGEALIAGHTQNALQTGEGQLVIRLRAMDQQPYATKRPQAGQASA